MKILSCKTRHFKSLARAYKVTWSIKLDDGRVVKAVEFRDWEDSVVDGRVEGIEYYEQDLADSIFDLTESKYYWNYEV